MHIINQINIVLLTCCSFFHRMLTFLWSTSLRRPRTSIMSAKAPPWWSRWLEVSLAKVENTKIHKDNPDDGVITLIVSNQGNSVWINSWNEMNINFRIFVFVLLIYLCISFSGKVRKTSAYKYNSLLEAVSLSIENLDDFRKKLYKQLAVFLDDVGIPPKVINFCFVNYFFKSIIKRNILQTNRYIHKYKNADR